MHQIIFDARQPKPRKCIYDVTCISLCACECTLISQHCQFWLGPPKEHAAKCSWTGFVLCCSVTCTFIVCQPLWGPWDSSSRIRSPVLVHFVHVFYRSHFPNSLWTCILLCKLPKRSLLHGQMNDPQYFSLFYHNICWLFPEEALGTSPFCVFSNILKSSSLKEIEFFLWNGLSLC